MTKVQAELDETKVVLVSVVVMFLPLILSWYVFYFPLFYLASLFKGFDVLDIDWLYDYFTYLLN